MCGNSIRMLWHFMRLSVSKLTDDIWRCRFEYDIVRLERIEIYLHGRNGFCRLKYKMYALLTRNMQSLA